MRAILLLFVFLAICAVAFSPNKENNKGSKKGKVVPPADDDDDTDPAILSEAEMEEEISSKKQKKAKPADKKASKKKDDDVPNIEMDEKQFTVSDLFELARDNRIDKLRQIVEETPIGDLEKLKELDIEKLTGDEDEEDVDPETYEACLGGKDELCHCNDDTMDCSQIVFHSDDPELRTTMLTIEKEGFIPYFVNFSANSLVKLQEDKIIPGIEKNVSVIDFSFNKIKNIDSNAFAKFKNISKLNFAHNNLNQINKKWFGPLSDTLHRLDLSYNKLTTLQDGAFSNLKNLKKLILDGNRITGLKKEHFEGLDNLEEISLDDCNLRSLPSDLFENLPKLNGVSLRHNPIDSVPAAINNVKKITYIDLSETEIPEIQHSSFATDTELEDIRMENMKYLSAIKDCGFCGVPKLKSITLENSKKLVEFHPNAFGFINSKPGEKTTGVTELYINNCAIKTLSDAMMDYENLNEIRVSGNPWNCTCDIVFLLDSKLFSFKSDPSYPTCASPEALAGRKLATLKGFEACEDIKSADRKTRFSTVFGLALLTCFLVLGGYHVITTGKLTRMLRRVQGIPNVAYSNLTNRAEENIVLESDFEARPAEV